MSIAKYYLSGSVPTPDAVFLPTLNRVRLGRGTPVHLVDEFVKGLCMQTL
jgi:hypothetical protein